MPLVPGAGVACEVGTCTNTAAALACEAAAIYMHPACEGFTQTNNTPLACEGVTCVHTHTNNLPLACGVGTCGNTAAVAQDPLVTLQALRKNLEVALAGLQAQEHVLQERKAEELKTAEKRG